MGFIRVGHDLEMTLKVKGRVVCIIWTVPKGKRVHAFQVVTLKNMTVSKQHITQHVHHVCDIDGWGGDRKDGKEREEGWGGKRGRMDRRVRRSM